MNAFNQSFGGHRHNEETHPDDKAAHTLAFDVGGVPRKAPATFYAAIKAAADGVAPTEAQRKQLDQLGIGVVDVTNEERERVAYEMLAKGVEPATINVHLKTIPTTYRAEKPIRLVTAFKAKAF